MTTPASNDGLRSGHGRAAGDGVAGPRDQRRRHHALRKGQFERDPGGAAERELLAAMMMTPPEVRLALLERPAVEADVWTSLGVPVRISHGEEDRVILPAMAEEGRRLMPHATLTLEEGIGHVPFVEDTETFNRNLADFVRDVSR